MNINEAQATPLDGGYPLAPICEKYLDRNTLGTAGAVESFIEDIIALYGKDEYSGWEQQIGSAKEYARAFADLLDPVSLNIIHTSWRNGLIEDPVLVKIRAQQYGPEEARNYVLLMIGIRDLEQNAGATRQFNGLHALLADENGNHVDRLDLSTDEAYTGNVALLRYSITVTGKLQSEGPRAWGEFFYVGGRDNEAIIVPPDMHQLVWDYQDQVDEIAQIVIVRKEQNVEQLRAMFSGEIERPLITGVL